MSNVKNVFDYIDALAPFKTAEDWDNSGLLIGSPTAKVEKALIALEITNEVIDEAIELRADLIITHHPVIFKPIKNIDESDLIYRLIANNIAVISAHTNLDVAKSGVNFTLADVLELSGIGTFEPVGDNLSLGRIGTLKRDYTPLEFARHVKTNLKCLGLRYVDG
ncbi:MAG: Nif3-like dinuclear metal center hexameric protein, partial [Oscillospiraceae bacterium]|nr:Nif3-like dinuclear metal center hexameric protein [Oscillospiraceae bacterium]